MILFKIHFDEEIYRPLYNDYCKFLFGSIKDSIRRQMKKEKYEIRESVIIKSSVIRWYKSPPKKLDIAKYINSCLELIKIRGEYVVALNERKRVKGSSTKVSTLVRLIEYGNEVITPYPLIRRIISYYQSHYKDMILEFMKERWM